MLAFQALPEEDKEMMERLFDDKGNSIYFEEFKFLDREPRRTEGPDSPMPPAEPPRRQMEGPGSSVPSPAPMPHEGAPQPAAQDGPTGSSPVGGPPAVPDLDHDEDLVVVDEGPR